MQAQKPCCPAAAARMIRKITLPNGSQVGIANLDQILNEVVRLGLIDVTAIKNELLARAKVHNYVEPVVEKEYADALFAVYEQQRAKTLKTGL
jgi:hypothetical protein